MVPRKQMFVILNGPFVSFFSGQVCGSVLYLACSDTDCTEYNTDCLWQQRTEPHTGWRFWSRYPLSCGGPYCRPCGKIVVLIVRSLIKTVALYPTEQWTLSQKLNFLGSKSNVNIKRYANIHSFLFVKQCSKHTIQDFFSIVLTVQPVRVTLPNEKRT